MKLEIIDNHSVAVDLLTDLPVLDAGCRGFKFTEHFAKRGHTVVALDPAPGIEVPNIEGTRWSYFYPWALVGPTQPKRAYLRMTEDAEARHLTNAPKEGDPAIECKSIAEIMDYCKIAQWDLVKLNVEGSEYDILAQWPGEIARQIVVSFHEHTGNRRGEAAIEGIVEHLGRWYAPAQHVFDERYCAGRNAWDSVFVLKELS